MSLKLQQHEKFEDFRSMIKIFYKEMRSFNLVHDEHNDYTKNIIIFNDSLITLINKISTSELSFAYKFHYLSLIE